MSAPSEGGGGRGRGRERSGGRGRGKGRGRGRGGGRGGGRTGGIRGGKGGGKGENRAQASSKGRRDAQSGKSQNGNVNDSSSSKNTGHGRARRKSNASKPARKEGGVDAANRGGKPSEGQPQNGHPQRNKKRGNNQNSNKNNKARNNPNHAEVDRGSSNDAEKARGAGRRAKRDDKSSRNSANQERATRNDGKQAKKDRNGNHNSDSSGSKRRAGRRSSNRKENNKNKGTNSHDSGSSGISQRINAAETKNVNLTRAQRRNLAAVEREKQRKIEEEKEEKAKEAAAKLAAEEAARKAEEEAKRAAQEAAKAAALARENEIRQIEETVLQMVEFEKSRREMRTLNLEDRVNETRNAWSKNKRKLKSDLKKTTALMKKLKNFTSASADAVCADLKKLNFSRFASEAAVALARSELKSSDLDGVLQVASFLHQRYADFTEPFLEGVMSVFANTGANGSDNSSQKRKRITLRLICKLLVGGIIPEPRNIMKIMRSITGASLATPLADSTSSNPFGESESDESSDEDGSSEENEDEDDSSNTQAVATSKPPEFPKFVVSLTDNLLAHMPLVIAVVKYEGEDFLSLPSEATQQLLDRAKALDVDTSSLVILKNELLLPKQMIAKMNGMMIAYFEAVSTELIKVHGKLRSKEKKVESERIMRGELSESSKEQLEKLQTRHEFLLSGATSLAAALGRQVPDLKEEDDDAVSDLSSAVKLLNLRSGGDSQGLGIWEDEAERAMYESIPDLRERLPGACLGDAIPKEKAEDKQDDDKQQHLTEDPVPENEIEKVTSEFDLDEKIPVGQIVEARLQQLEGIMNKEGADRWAIDFGMHNSKGSRRRLVKELYMCDRRKSQLLPYYARIAAIYSRCFRDVGPPLVKLLWNQFYAMLKKKDPHRLESKLHNARYIAELAKFKVCPPVQVFSMLKKCFEDFAFHNVDIVCCLVESCGPFLLNSPVGEVASRMEHNLQVMMRLKKARNLAAAAATMIENAFYVCKPPENTAPIAVVIPPLVLYVRDLLWRQLSSTSSLKQVVLRLGKLPWSDPSVGVAKVVRRTLLNVTALCFSRIPLICSLIKKMEPQVPTLLTHVVDEALYTFRANLARNKRAEHQERVGLCRLIAELHNQRLLQTPILFDTLYFILDCGHFGKRREAGIEEESGLEKIQEEDEEETGVEESFDNNVANEGQQQQSSRMPEKPSIYYRFALSAGRSRGRGYDPLVPCRLDPPSSQTRIILACTMLNGCKGSFLNGAFRTQMHRFLIHLQRYALAKRSLHPLPPHAEFLLMDTFESLSPKMMIFESVHDANVAVAKLHANDPEIHDRKWLSAADVNQAGENNEEDEEGDIEEDDNDGDDDDDNDEEEEADADDDDDNNEEDGASKVLNGIEDNEMNHGDELTGIGNSGVDEDLSKKSLSEVSSSDSQDEDFSETSGSATESNDDSEESGSDESSDDDSNEDDSNEDDFEEEDTDDDLEVYTREKNYTEEDFEFEVS